MKKTKKIVTTKLQKKAVDNILSGKFKSKNKAMQSAGYSKMASRIPKTHLAEGAGTKKYLSLIKKQSEKRYGKPLSQKVSEVYVDGLEATTSGKFGDNPDFKTRLAYADRLSDFMGWVDNAQDNSKFQQFNFFSVNEKTRKEQDGRFKKFIRNYYK